MKDKKLLHRAIQVAKDSLKFTDTEYRKLDDYQKELEIQFNDEIFK